MSELYECPCCGQKTLQNPDFYEICLKCGWEDDIYQKAHPDEKYGANALSLNEARAEWNRTHKNFHGDGFDKIARGQGDN